jgi:hypothetical protein
MDEVRRMMLDRHARYMPVMDKRMLMGVISFYDVAKAVVDSQNFENKMLKAYIRDWPKGRSLAGSLRFEQNQPFALCTKRKQPLFSWFQRFQEHRVPMSGNTRHPFYVTNGESHGPAICVIDGCPPGMAVEADIQPDLDRRRPGTSRHVTQRNEPDAVEILSGVYEGKTTGTPIAC